MRIRRNFLIATAASLALTTVAAAPALATKSGSGSDTGTGRIFMVNPVQSSGNEDLTDQNDSASAVPDSAYADAQLRNLDGSGYLRGRWVTVESATGTPAPTSVWANA